MKEVLNVNSTKFPTLDVNLLQYSDKYFDDKYEYRHVILPKEFHKFVPRTHLMTETEWRNLGIQQSPGWVHYLLHAPEPHVLMFRRIIQPNTAESTAANVEEIDNDNDVDRDDTESINDIGTIDYEMNEKDDTSDVSIDSNSAEFAII